MEDQVYYNRLNCQINLSLLVIAFIIGLFYWILSFGFEDNSVLLITESILISCVLLLLPELIKIIYNKTKKTFEDRWYNSVSCITVAVVIILTILGFFQSAWEIKLGNYIIYIGAFLIVLFIIKYSISYFRLIDLFYICLFTLFALFIGSTLWKSGISGPFFVEQLSTVDLNEIDTLYHAAIMGIIKTYSVPSTGLDGTPYHPYHWGSHWIFAQFSSLLNVYALKFRALCHPIIFIPLYLKSFILFINSIRKYRNINFPFDAIFYIIIVSAFIHYTSTFYGNPIGNPSYVLSLTFTLFFLSIILEFLGIYGDKKFNSKFSDNLFLFLIIPLFICLITSIKVSAGYPLVVLYGFLFIRMKCYKDIRIGISFLLSLIFLLIILHYTIAPSITRGVNIISSIASIFKFGRISFIFQYLWLLIFIISFLYVKKIKSLEDLKNILQSKKYILEIEILPLILIFGLIPGIILDWAGGGADFYFYNVQYWLGLCLFLAYLPIFIANFQLNDIFKKRELKSYFIIFIIIGFTLEISANYFSQVTDNIRHNLTIRQRIINNEQKLVGIRPFLSEIFKDKSIYEAIRTLTKSAKSSQIALNDNNNYQFIKILKELDKLELSEKRRTCIYIPKTNRVFWDLQSHRQDGTPFIVPALTGIAMIEGLPDYLPFPANTHRGYNTYNKDFLIDNKAKLSNLSNLELKSKARQHGFSKIIKIGFENNRFVTDKIDISI